ncbi:hypothetical protein C9374_004458 [Naegleria lovaniensis]|uniref:ERCC1-like central domain-containing protein n=1 Tax=Naegleria lovaniensis TaxID=51637 RepID=A0AA88KNZ1_NAELO|nr:uncharacterized protein C9374_004458 [Naegleria lovaniensis]KAG2383121.1 hypothetical protein C9374_004458 [Naegleria lovaniensis]
MSQRQNSAGSSSSSDQQQFVVNVMDIDIDEEQEKEAREFELYRQNTVQRLAELKKNSSSEKISSTTIMTNSSNLNISSTDRNNTTNNSGKYVSTIVKYNQFTNNTNIQRNASSSPNATTSPSVSLLGIPNTKRPPGFVPQKFIPPPRKDSQNSQKSSADSATSSGNNSQTMNFALKPPISDTLDTTSTTSTTPVKNSTITIPPFTSSSPSSATSSSPSASVHTGEFQIPFPMTATSITANAVQKKNPITKHIREGVFKVNYVPEWKLTDFILGRRTTALYVSLKYHMTNPRFILERIRNFHKTEVCKNKAFTVKVVLVNVDVSIEASSGNASNNDETKPKSTPTFVSETALDEALIEITRICMWGDWTMLCAFSDEECALYLETLRYCENKSASTIQGPIQAVPSLSASMSNSNTATKKKSGSKKRWSKERYTGSSSSGSSGTNSGKEVEKISHTEEVHQLFAVSFKRTLNKRDHVTLLNHFGSVKEVIQTSADELTDLPGFGKKKVKRIINLFQTPFIPGKETKSSDNTTPNSEKKEYKKKIQLVRKTRASPASSSSSNNQESDNDDDVLIVNKETGEEEKVRKTTKKQTNLSIFFSQPQTKLETQDSEEE